MFFFQLPEMPEWLISRDDFAGLETMFRKATRPGTFSETDIAIYKEALRKPGALTAAINYYRANFFSIFAGGGERQLWAEPF